MERYIFFGIGSPSDAKAFEKRYASLKSKTIYEYLTQKQIRHTAPVTVSCHRTLDRAIEYPLKCQGIVDSAPDGGIGMVAVLFGGMSFALPGIFSSVTTTIPVIGVPAYSEVHGGGIDAATAVYNLPPGTVVAGAPIHSAESPSLDRAVLIAEKMLSCPPSTVRLVTHGDVAKHVVAAKEVLNHPESEGDDAVKGIFGIHYSYQHEPVREKDLGLVMHICSYNSDTLKIDGASYLALQCRIPRGLSEGLARDVEFLETVNALKTTKNTLYFGGSKNAALFLVRMLALSSPLLRDKLREHAAAANAGTEGKYGTKVSINQSIFK